MKRKTCLRIGRTIPALIVLSTTGCASTRSGPTHGLTSELNRYEFERVVSPRNNLSPGTIVTVSKTTAGDVDLKMLCSREDAFAGIREPRRAATENERLQIGSEKHLGIDGELLARIKAKASFAWLQDIELELANTEVLEYASADFPLSGRQPHCTHVLARPKGSDPKVITRVLRADVTYHVKAKNTADVSVKISRDQLEALLAELNGDSINERDLTIVAKGLYVGVKYEPDPYDLSKYTALDACAAIRDTCEGLVAPPFNVDRGDGSQDDRIAPEDMAKYMPRIVDSIDYLRIYSSRFRSLPSDVKGKLELVVTSQEAKYLIKNLNDYKEHVRKAGNDPAKVTKPYDLKPVFDRFEPVVSALRTAASECRN